MTEAINRKVKNIRYHSLDADAQTPTTHCGVEKEYLVWLITTRPLVRIQPPLPSITLAHMTFHSLPFAPRKIVATEARLNKIYDAAKLGLKGDALALASGMLPTEYRQLCELDPIADMAALKGKADGELEMSQCLHKAAKEGDAKAALAILQHSHGWVAKQSISIDVDQRISIIGALRQAESRVVDVIAHEPSQALQPRLKEAQHANAK